MRLNKLKPCPFCGSEDIEILHNTNFDYEKAFHWIIGCVGCDAEFSICDSKEQAIEFWNGRTNNSDLEIALVDVIDSLILENMYVPSFTKSRILKLAKEYENENENYAFK